MPRLSIAIENEISLRVFIASSSHEIFSARRCLESADRAVIELVQTAGGSEEFHQRVNWAQPVIFATKYMGFREIIIAKSCQKREKIR